ncbi:MAG: PRC-barrel domain protein [bacterium ADurb.Bin212]|nr:MAG: PRC-barrel domain protein [bacterium ADurb.Bin212]
MIVSYSQIIGSEILAINEQKTVGKVSDVVIQKNDLKIKGFLLHSPFFFVPPKAIAFGDILEIDNRAVVTQKDENILPLKELVSIEKSIKSKLCGVKQRVVTKSGTAVGVVYDYTIESSTGLIYSLYVKKFLTEKIIPRSIILELKENIYTIEDDYELIKNSATMPETA